MCSWAPEPEADPLASSFSSLPECVSGSKLCWGGKSRQRELETKDCQKDRYWRNRRRNKKLWSSMADVSTCSWGWGEEGRGDGGGALPGFFRPSWEEEVSSG